jgi:hypothetical protein
MATIRLTQQAVERLSAPAAGRAYYWDRHLPGFGLRITSKGAKSWIASYRLADGRKVVGAGQKSGHYNVLDALTGEVLFRPQLVEQANQLGGLQTGGALAGDTLARLAFSGRSISSPSVSNGRVFIGGGNLLFQALGLTPEGSLICLGLPGDE